MFGGCSEAALWPLIKHNLRAGLPLVVKVGGPKTAHVANHLSTSHNGKLKGLCDIQIRRNTGRTHLIEIQWASTDTVN